MTPADDPAAANPARTGSNYAQVSASRSLTMAAVGALIGLLMAGYALFTAKGTSTLVVPAADVALVNQQPIARSDFFAQMKTLYNIDYEQTTVEQRRKVLDALIREELFVQRGKELDVASVDADVRSAMVNAVEQGVAADAIESRPSDEALKSYFLKNRGTYSSEGLMTVRDLVFPAANANNAAQALELHQSMDTVMARFQGKDSGRVKGQEFYFAAKIHLGDTLFDAARVLAGGGISAAVALPDGVHILYMIDNQPPVPQSFDAVRAQVLGDYQKAAVARLLDGAGQFLRKRANIQIADDLR